jgi:hypothetical protein
MSEYVLNAIKNEDFLISDIKHANKLIIRSTGLGNYLEFTKNNDPSILYKIPLRDIENVDITEQDIGKIKETKDKIIQIVFNDEQSQRIIIWVNPGSSYVDDVRKEIEQLRREESSKDSKYW